jgi:insulysin
MISFFFSFSFFTQRKEGPKEWVFNESRDIAAMNFRFKSKSKPINYTVSCVTGMHIFPPEKTLCGNSLV